MGTDQANFVKEGKRGQKCQGAWTVSPGSSDLPPRKPVHGAEVGSVNAGSLGQALLRKTAAHAHAPEVLAKDLTVAHSGPSSRVDDFASTDDA